MGKTFELYEDLRRKRHLTRAELVLRAKVERVLDDAASSFSESVEELFASPGADEILVALESGTLLLDDLGARPDNEETFFDEVVARVAERMKAVASPASTEYPLFDDDAGMLLRAMTNEGQVEAPYLELANRVGVARRLIADLEAFPNASGAAQRSSTPRKISTRRSPTMHSRAPSTTST